MTGVVPRLRGGRLRCSIVLAQSLRGRWRRCAPGRPATPTPRAAKPPWPGRRSNRHSNPSASRSRRQRRNVRSDIPGNSARSLPKDASTGNVPTHPRTSPSCVPAATSSSSSRSLFKEKPNRTNRVLSKPNGSSTTGLKSTVDIPFEVWRFLISVGSGPTGYRFRTSLRGRSGGCDMGGVFFASSVRAAAAVPVRLLRVRRGVARRCQRNCTPSLPGTRRYGVCIHDRFVFRRSRAVRPPPRVFANSAAPASAAGLSAWRRFRRPARGLPDLHPLLIGQGQQDSASSSA